MGRIADRIALKNRVETHQTPAFFSVTNLLVFYKLKPIRNIVPVVPNMRVDPVIEFCGYSFQVTLKSKPTNIG